MDLGHARCPIGESNRSVTLHFAPPTLAVGTIQVTPNTYPTPHGDCFNISNAADDFKAHSLWLALLPGTLHAYIRGYSAASAKKAPA